MFKKKSEGEIEALPQKEKKPKKEKKPLDAAGRKKRRRIITCSIIGVIILFVVVKNVLGAGSAQTFVATAGAVSGEIE